MGLIKLCPACKEENPVSEVICRVCMTNLSSISPTLPSSLAEPAAEKRNEALASPNADSTVFLPPEALTLARVSDGFTISVKSGCVLGRGGETFEFFKELKTVSRRHARIVHKDGAWTIEDMGSTNGTWLNGRRIETDRCYALQKGDKLTFSLACEMRVL
ncbi:MAG: FHA domain-containing protein [Synergistaceae bacterium]|nr:FHA domain-containing protein [Synergistaceae bacterium]